MNLLNKLERKLGWLAVPQLPIYIVTAQALCYVWMMLNPENAHLLELRPIAVVEGGEYWRLLTFLFITPLQNPIFAFFYLYLLYAYGSQLEMEWGSFPFTLFYLFGILGTIVAAFFLGSTDGAFFLNTTIFLAFAAIHPNFELLFIFILPIKVKWLAWLTWVYFGYLLVMAPLLSKAGLLVSLLNYLLFFGPTHVNNVKTRVAQYRHRRRFKNWEIR